MQLQVLAHTQFFIQRKRLRHITHPHPRGHIARVDRRAQQLGVAFGGGQQAGEHFHGGGFAAAVAAEKAENLAFFDFKTHMIDGGKLAETLGQPVRFHCRRRSGVGHKRRDVQPARALLFFGRQHLDIRLFQRIGLIVRHHFASGAVHQQLARVHRQQVFKLLGLFNIGGRHHHRHPRVFGAQVVHQRPKLAARQRIHAGGRLVQNQQIGRMHQRTTQA